MEALCREGPEERSSDQAKAKETNDVGLHCQLHAPFPRTELQLRLCPVPEVQEQSAGRNQAPL